MLVLPRCPSLIETKSFTSLQAPLVFSPSLAVAVPSRLYYESSKTNALAGLRVAIDDNFNLKGVKSAASNRDFLDFQQVSKRTAPAIQDLIDKGAIIVGKTKITAFADQGSADWTDYHCPFNPRGDGYLVPHGSSTGSAVAVAGYDWLDVSIDMDSKY